VTRAAILAVDGGNSKADVLLATRDGRLLGFRRGETISHQQVGLGAGVERLVALAESIAAGAGIAPTHPLADVGSYCLAGADFPAEIRRLEKALGRSGLAERTIVRNDTFGALRAGSTRPWGVVLICGHGINGAAIGRDGRQVRFDAVGNISGDWGGGHAIGEAGLAAAVRANDGRGRKTVLEDRVARFFERRSIGAVVRDLYYGRIDEERLDGLAPLVFETAAEGDVAARAIVDRLADELVAMARALVHRTRLERAGPEIVLAGGVFRTREPGFYARLESGIRRVAPEATMVRLEAPPVLGAALIGLDALGLGEDRARDAERRLRAAVGTHARGPAAEAPPIASAARARRR
jgi:N-acetylglucosamine kinase-like BadF-type ATPase